MNTSTPTLTASVPLGIALSEVTNLIDRGFAVVPVEYRGKKPSVANWGALRVTYDSVSSYFGGVPRNVGVILGSASGDIVDVDLDAMESLELAAHVLPPTASFGRKSKPCSHYLYRSVIHKRICYEDPAPREGETAMLLEIRSNGGQTVCPGSTHVSGERIEWATDSEPLRITGDELQKRCAKLAGLTLLRRHWPARGSRHAAAIAVTGVLARAGIDAEEIASVVTALNGGESLQKHRGLAADALRRAAALEPLFGVPSLLEVFGQAIGSRALAWLGIGRDRSTPASIQASVEQLTLESPTSAIEEVLASLHAAGLSDLDSHDVLCGIKRRTGRTLDALRRTLRRNTQSDGESGNQSDRLLSLAKEGQLWTDTENGEPFATITKDGHEEHLRISSPAYSQYLSYMFNASTGKVPDRATVQNVVSTAAGIATHSGQKHRAWLRVAQTDDAIYLDLGDAHWRAVRITPVDWEVVGSAPVKFRRAGGHALPTPERGGDVELLREFVNASDNGFKLVVGCLVSFMRPDKTFPILCITGEKGSAKTTLLSLLRRLIDPASAQGAGLPKKEDDLVVCAANNWVVSGDNVSWIEPEMADALCRLSTGGGIQKRKLYSDGDEYKIDARRPIMLTGINDPCSREDFLDRSVVVDLEPITEGRRTEEEVLKAFLSVYPKIFGALLDAVVVGLRNLPATKLINPPRLADFATFVEAASPSFGWPSLSFVKAYEEMRAGMFEDAAMGNLVVQAVVQWLRSQSGAFCGFNGNPDELHKSLVQSVCMNGDGDRTVRAREWPKSGAALIKRLKTSSSGLRQLGIDVVIARTAQNRSQVYVNWVPGRREPEPPPIDDLPF